MISQSSKKIIIPYLLLCVITLSISCKKDEEVQQKEFISVTTVIEDLDKTTGIYNDIKNYILNGINNSIYSFETVTKIEATESVDYSFDLVNTTISSNYVPVSSTVNYSGSIPGSLFTERGDGVNKVKISIQGRTPTIFVNNVKVGNQSGTGGGTGTGGTGTDGTQELKKTRVEGNSGGKSYIDFSLPKDAKTLVIKTTELSNSDLNMADVFVSRNTIPTVTSNYPYKYNADYSHTTGNRGEKVITIKNAKAGNWHIMLYGFNSYYWSWVIVRVEY